MIDEGGIAALVRPDSVHGRCYTDAELFELEIRRLWSRAWIYAGHESQVKRPGDYATFEAARQPMMMIRGRDGAVRVFFDRCPHRGARLCGRRRGNAGESIRCSYHGWSFEFDGRLDSIPYAKGYEGTSLQRGNPEFDLAGAPRTQSYRGFVFVSLDPDVPPLAEWLGPARIGIDDMCDRSPEGEVEAVGDCHRVVQRSNWKFFMENQLDVSHAMVTHESTGRAALEVEDDIAARTGQRPLHYHMLSAFTWPTHKWNELMLTTNYPNGHSVLGGYMALRPQDPDSLEHERQLAAAWGEAKKEEILSRSIHHVLIYPGISIQPPLQQLRVLRPVAPDRTVSEIWHFRLKGVNEPIYRRALWYYNLVNSPSTMVNADDLENWNRIQRGLAAGRPEWLSFHRNAGQDELLESGAVRTREGLSEAPLRNQFRAWLGYMGRES